MSYILDIITVIGWAAVLGAFFWFGKKIQILDDLKDASDKIKTNVDIVCRYLTKNHADFNSSELRTFSPVQLTEEGMQFIEGLGFDKVFTEHKDVFFNLINKDNPKLKYDVENSSIRSIFVLYDEPFMEFLKIYLYNNPNRRIENTAPTLGIYIRDKYLAEHPEIEK